MSDLDHERAVQVHAIIACLNRLAAGVPRWATPAQCSALAEACAALAEVLRDCADRLDHLSPCGDREDSAVPRDRRSSSQSGRLKKTLSPTGDNPLLRDAVFRIE
jgi:hypothetical protein